MEDLPKIIHIGTQKAGSTYLYHLFAQHPDISLSKYPENNYYLKYYDKGKNWYLDSFNNKGTKIETSPKYFQKGEIVAPRIKDTLGNQDVKLLLILRNPVDYLNSHFRMHLHQNKMQKRKDKYKNISSDITTFIENNPHYLNRAAYYKTLKNSWLQYFSLDDFKIIFFEEFIRDTKGVMDELFMDFGLRRIDLSLDKSIYKNKMLKNKYLWKMRQSALKNRVMRKAGKMILNMPVIRDIFSYITTDTSANLLSESDRKVIADYYKDDVGNLTRLLGLSSTPWKDFE